jgi:hypothetical protein
VLASCVTAVAQAICLANPEADPTRLDRRLATAWLVCRDLLTVLDLPDRAGEYSEGGVEEMKKAFTERGWSGPAAEGLVTSRWWRSWSSCSLGLSRRSG